MPCAWPLADDVQDRAPARQASRAKELLADPVAGPHTAAAQHDRARCRPSPTH